MSLRRTLFALCIGALAVALPAEAALIDLYSADDYQYFGPSASGQYRAQRFSPSESTPNALADPSFDSAAFKISLSDPTESLTGSSLQLFAWNTDHNTTVAGTPIASVDVNLLGPFDDWVTVTFAPQPSSGQYLLALKVGTFSGTDFGLYRSNSNDGGPNNDAYNNSNTVRTDREYQVRLDAVPEPATIAILALGSLLMIRRR